MSVSYNYFGDTVLSFDGEDKEYCMFQYNCSAARELLRRVEGLVREGYVVLINDTNWMSENIVPAVPYIERIIKLNDDVAELERTHHISFSADGPGAEIAGHYGY